MSEFLLAAEVEFAGQMAPNCRRTSRRGRQRTRAAGRHSESAIYTSSPNPPRSAIYAHAAGSPLPVRRKCGAKVYYPCLTGFEVKNPGVITDTHAPPRISLQGDCLSNGIGCFICSHSNLTENTRSRDADGSGRKYGSSVFGQPCVKSCTKREVVMLNLP